MAIKKSRVVKSTGNEQSFTVRATVLRKQENGQYVRLATFAPTVRTRPGEGVVDFLGALDYALRNDVGIGDYEVVSSDHDSTAVVSTADPDIFVWIGYIRSSARCSVCGSTRESMQPWCDGDCKTWRDNPQATKIVRKRAGFGALVD